MTQMSEDIFQNFCTISQRVQNLQRKIETENVTPQIRVDLHKELETLQGSMETLRQKAFQTQSQVQQQFSQFDEMDTQIITLYRMVEEQFENYEIALISKEAMELGESLTSNQMVKVAKQINTLSHNIHFLFKHRKPSLRHRKIVHLATKLLEQGSEILKTKAKDAKQHVQLVQLLETLLKEAVTKAEDFLDPNEGELAMELYEIAELFYHKKEKQARLQCQLLRSRLSPSAQRRLDEALLSPEERVEILLEMADGVPSMESTQIIPILQA